MRLRGKVFAAMLLVLFTAGQAWAAFCWSASVGGTMVLEIGQGVGSFIPVMGAFLAPASFPACLGQRIYPSHGIAKIVGNTALVGFTNYSEGSDPNCESVVGEISIDLTTLIGTGFTRHVTTPTAPVDPFNLTPVTCP